MPPRPRAEVVFCFRYLDLDHAQFGCAHRDAPYAHKLVERLKAICTMRPNELLQAGGTALRCHPIDFVATTEQAGFASLPAHLRDVQGIQFQLSQAEYGRVHGFMIDNVFHVVWIDPEHALYG